MSWNHAAVLAALLLVACGDDEPAADPAPAHGTCDLRPAHASCIEATGTSRSISDQEAGCADAGGSWSDAPCEAAATLVGCCSYTFGQQFRECFYEGTTTADPAAYCATWDDGVWTPAG